MPDRFSPIGVFDSGVGGISVLGELRRTLPREDFLYFGDNLHAPYGTKPEQEVLGYVRSVMDYLIAQDVKAVVIACNTATSGAAAQLRSELPLPIIGMEPALKPAAEQRRGGQILVLATPMTLRLPKFQALYAGYYCRVSKRCTLCNIVLYLCCLSCRHHIDGPCAVELIRLMPGGPIHKIAGVVQAAIFQHVLIQLTDQCLQIVKLSLCKGCRAGELIIIR